MTHVQTILKRAKRMLASLIEERLGQVLGDKAEAKRVMPCISEATGGPVPEFDITDGSALQEMDDLEYVERMKCFK